MDLFLIAIAGLIATGLAAAALAPWPRLGQRVGQGGTILACGLGLAPAVTTLAGGGRLELLAPWSMVGGSFHLLIDPLAALFLLPIFGVSALGALYGAGYLRHHEGHQSLGPVWLFLDLLIASMAMVVAAHDGLLFLLSWEVMAIAPFFLVAFDDDKAPVRDAAWTYLIATHMGTAFLFVMFFLLAEEGGSMDFDTIPAAIQAAPHLASICFVLAVVGLGSKAGFVPMHVWLPEAHPVAPSHVSALMSGVMIKTGIYGLVRLLTLTGEPAAWWSWLLIGLGAASGIFGVVFALAQGDLKRLLAYSSMENIGIILLGLGVGVGGVANHAPLLACLGFAGGLLHVVNHALFKSLLFLGAGAVQHAAHTLNLEELGGLLKRMPFSGAAFFVGVAAIVGLVPLNGFVSEFLILVSAFLPLATGHGSAGVAGVTVLVTLGLISGLAAACFARAFATVYLGTPRTAPAAAAHEVGWEMAGAMGVLACACVAIGLGAPWAVHLLVAPVAVATGLSMATVAATLDAAAGWLAAAILAFAIALALAATLWLLRRTLQARAGVERQATWGCGYGAPTPRMQYTASSFAQPLTHLFHPLLHTHVEEEGVAAPLPAAARFASHAPDLFRDLLFNPLFRGVERLMLGLRWLQHGNIHLYILYIVVTLLVLLMSAVG